MRSTIIVGVLLNLIACNLKANANPIGQDGVESQVESPMNAVVEAHFKDDKPSTEDVVIDTETTTALDDSLVNSLTEPELDSTKIESCLAAVSKNLNDLIVPEKVENLAQSIRSLNANLPSKHLTDLIVDKRASLDVYNAGFVKKEELDLYVQECSEFVENFLGIVGSSECGDRFINIINPHNEKDYKTIMEKHDDVDKIVGYTEACFIL